MKKAIFLAFLSFFVGVAMAGTILVNPFRWAWVDPVQHRALSWFQPAHDHGADAEGQLWTCGMHPQVIQDEPGDCPICGMKLIPMKKSTVGGGTSTKATGERKVKYWRAPMDPTFISDKPGKSPMGMDLIPVYEDESTAGPSGERKVKYWRGPMDPTFISDKPGKSPMGMDLIPVYEDEAAAEPEEGVVRIDPAFVQNIGVQSVEVTRRDIPFSIRTVGTVTYNDKQVSWINTKYAGWLENVRVNYVGEPIQKGQKVFEIYSPQLVTTQQEYLDALEYAERLSSSGYPDILRRARSLVESSRKRLEYWDITPEQIRELEKSREPRRTLSVVSPVSGLVVGKMDQALEGMYVKPGMNLYKIVDLSTVWVDAEVFEHQIPWLKVGQTATIELPYEPGRKYRGTIRYIYPYFTSKTRTMKVSIELPNPDQKLRAEMYANVVFEVPSARGVLTVPEESVIHSGTRNVVVLQQGDGSFRVAEVALGVNGDGVWEVSEGIEEGDRVVTSAQFLIDSESNLKEAISKMIAASRGGSDDKATTAEETEQTQR